MKKVQIKQYIFYILEFLNSMINCNFFGVVLAKKITYMGKSVRKSG